MTDLKNERRGGFYFKNNNPYISVTTVLGVIDKPALRYWFGQQVYEAMLKDPTLKEKEALAAPYKTSQKAMDRGSLVHSVVEAYKNGQEPDLKDIPDQFQGYVKGFYRWAKEMKIEVLEQEKTVFDDNLFYAGTLDMKVRIDDKVYVIDLKTGKDIYPEAFLQTAAYANALDEVIDGIGVVVTMENGDYKWQSKTEFAKEYKAFLAAQTLFEGLNIEKLKKLEYKGGEL